MRISLLQIVLSVLCMSMSFAHETSAQDLLNKKVTIHLNKNEIVNVLEKIERQAQVNFIYSPEIINAQRSISVNANEKALGELLTELLSPLDITFEVLGKQIILKRRKNELLTKEALLNLSWQVPDVVITGRIKDTQGENLVGVSVQIKGTTRGITSDSEGKFTISVPDEQAVLVFTSVGYQKLEVLVGKQTSINIVLQTDINNLNEVVVVGYGTQKRSDLTGSVSKLDNKAFKDQPVVNASSALQGRVAGVSVTNSSGAPGGAVKIRIRGANSVNANNDPLYVIDGVALTSLGLSDINVNDIESMEVLKDASSTAIYGSRGANGVILITTKSGKSGKPKVEYNSFVSLNKPMKRYHLMDAVTYANVANTTSGVSVFPNPQSFSGNSTNWQDLIFNDAATQSHQFSLSGGGASTKYYVSVFNVEQNGLMINTSQKKFGLRTNLDVNISDKIDFSINLFASRLNSHNNTDVGGKGNPLMSALTWAPTEPVYDEPGRYNRMGISPIWTNPYMVINERNTNTFANVGVINGKLKFKITDWLTWEPGASLNLNISNSPYLNNEWINPGSTGSGNSSAENYTVQTNNILTFRKVIDKHDVTATGVLETTSNQSQGFNAFGTGLATLSNGYNNLGLNASQSISSYFSNWSLFSYMARVAYNYNGKYLLTATYRRDGSSKFQGDNKWSNFPSFSAGWKLSNENFVKELNVFSSLKLRAGWGITGNQAIGPYSTLGLLTSTPGYSYGASTLYPGYTIGDPATPGLRWETTKQTDIGIDMSILKGRLNITADYYNKNTNDLLLRTRIANYDGGGTFLKNAGEVNNKGFELMVEGTILETKKFSWSASANFYTNSNTVVSLGPDSLLERPMNNGLISNAIQVVKVGEPMSAFYMIPWEGVYQSDFKNYSPGDAKYRDVNGNGTIGFEDRVVSGSALPKFQLGFNNTITYKNLTLNVFVQGAYGNKIFNATYAATAIPTSDVKFITLKEAANYWTPTNTSSTWRNPGSHNKAWVESTQFLQDGSYTRLKNISLSYNLDKSILKVMSAKIYVSAQNLFTITKYKGYDPEASSTSASSDIDGGIDLGAYPSPKTITIGAQITF